MSQHDTEMTAEDYAAARSYAMVIEWSEEDGVFVVTVPDLRRCRTHGATREEAAKHGEEAIASMLATFANSGVPFPEPRFTALNDTIYARPAMQGAQRTA